MTQNLIKNWIHIPGRHCASTALCDLMNFYGYRMTEPECFGIGQGIGFWYIEGLVPSRMIHVRSMDIEKIFFNNIGVDFKWEKAGSEEEIKTVLLASIDSGMPVLLRTDIFYLDYYKSKTHFPGHAIIFWGYDPENNIAYISDTERKGLTQCKFDSLLKAILHGNFPEGAHAHFAPIAKPVFILRKRKLSIKAAGSNARQMLSPDQFDGYGVRGMRLASKKVIEWKNLREWKWLARFAYQVIEKRGTGGGGFRKMYTEFLAGFAGKRLISMMKNIASGWTGKFKAVSESDKSDFSIVSDMLLIQALKEEEFYRKISEGYEINPPSVSS